MFQMLHLNFLPAIIKKKKNQHEIILGLGINTNT